MHVKEIKNIKDIIQNQYRGYTATLYGNESSAKYAEECDDELLLGIIKRNGLMNFVKCLSK